MGGSKIKGGGGLTYPPLFPLCWTVSKFPKYSGLSESDVRRIVGEDVRRIVGECLRSSSSSNSLRSTALVTQRLISDAASSIPRTAPPPYPIPTQQASSVPNHPLRLLPPPKKKAKSSYRFGKTSKTKTISFKVSININIMDINRFLFDVSIQ